jgi:hypothetical protein
MLPGALRITARGFVVLGAVALVIAAIFPTSLSPYAFLGLALWVLALLLTLSRTYILRAPWPGAGGLFEHKAHPVGYHASFFVAIAVFGFILAVLIRAYVLG